MESWKEKAEAKQKSILAKIPAQWHLPEAMCAMPTTPDGPYLNVTTDAFMGEAGLSLREITVTSKTSIPEILANYEAQEVSAEELVTTFCHRAAISHQTTECLAEIRFAEAIAEAKAQDEYRRVHKKLVGPLHGIPVSLKDQFRVEGLESAISYIGWLGKFETAETESLITKQVKELGGIIIGKVNSESPGRVPSLLNTNALIDACSANSALGRIAVQPAPSGNEPPQPPAVARRKLRWRGSSARMPRLRDRDGDRHGRSLSGKPVVPPVPGPMSASLDNVIHLAQSVLGNTEAWRRDPGLVPLRWRAPVLDLVRADAATPEKGLCFAAFPGAGDDGVMRLHPPVARGVAMAVRAAREARHRVIDWQPPSHVEGAIIYGGLRFPTTYDNEDALKSSGEPMIGAVEAMLRPTEKYRPKNMGEYYELVKKMKKYQEDYADYWEFTKALTGTGRPVDGIIAPVAATAAVHHNSAYAFSYAIVYNVLDYSILTVPVIFADKNIDVADPHDAPRSPIDEMSWGPWWPVDDADVYHGAPVGVQIVGRRFEEEKVLALGEALSSALKAMSVE
ncbi:uncharacterized protein PG986_012657 [Apiospora aurea]|uniref:Amidase domain-containing protein n=1 Tax=Apiospora aurea TaxID=335848 RepID=A0ABR1Q0L8_9PEZI